MAFQPLSTSLRTAAALTSLAVAGSAQALVGYDGVTGDVIVFTGTPLTCGYPGGPIHATVPLLDSGLCPGMPLAPGAPSTTSEGALYVQENGNLTVCAQILLGRYDPTGSSLSNSDMSAWGFGPLTGATIERGGDFGGGDAIWYTDGTKLNRFSAGAPCGGLPSGLLGPGVTPYAGPGILTGLGYDYTDDTLWACTSLGRVVHLTNTGVEIGSFLFPTPMLSGLAVDSASETIYVTDGTVVAGYDKTGAIKSDAWWPTGAEVSPGALVGLDWIPAGLAYGSGALSGGGAVPALFTTAWSYLGNTGYALQATGDPGTNYFLFYSVAGSLCPPLSLLGMNLLIAPPVHLVGGALADGAGNATFSLPLPTTPTLKGVIVHVQAAGFLTSGGLASTNALAFPLADY